MTSHGALGYSIRKKYESSPSRRLIFDSKDLGLWGGLVFSTGGGQYPLIRGLKMLKASGGKISEPFGTAGIFYGK